MIISKRLALATAASSLVLGGALSTPAQAAPVITGGLVNVTLTNVLNNNTVSVAVPIQAAVGICGVTVNVLSAALAPTGTQTFNCPASNGNQSVSVTG